MTSVSVLFNLAWEQFVQHYRASDNRLMRWTQGCLLFLLLLLSMTSFNIQQYLERNMHQLLGADVVVTSFTDIKPTELDYLQANSEKLSKNQLIDITLSFGGNYQQAQLKVIDNNYPVHGFMQVSDSLGGAVSDSRHGPSVGQVWIDSRLLTALQLSVGDELILADKPLTVTKIIEHEPDRLMEGHSVAMRAMVHQDSLSTDYLATSQSSFRYLMATSTPKSLIEWASSHITGASVLHRDGGHPLASFWQRVENFLGLSSVLLFLMAAIAIDLISRRQLVSQKRFVAVIMSMGTSRSRAISIGFIQWLIAFIALLPAILVLVYGALHLVIGQLQGQFAGIEMLWSWTDVVKTLTILLLLLLTFQVPSAIELSRVTVADLIRDRADAASVGSRFVWSVISIGALAAIYADNWLLTAMTLGVMVITVVMLMALTWLVLTGAEKLSQGRAGLLPFSLFMMKQRLLSKSTQILGVGLCALLLLSTLGLMRDIGNTMEKYRRTHDGNLIVSQASEPQAQAIKQWAVDNNSTVKQLRGFSLAQLVQVNELSLAEFSKRPSDSMASLQKPIRLHFTDKVPANNKVTSGTWWLSKTENYAQVSVEEEIMTDLGLTFGDKLVFQIDGKLHSFEIVAGHEYKPGNGSVTFWFQAPLSFDRKFDPTTYFMGSMELPEQAWANLGQLWQQFPSLKMLSIAQLTAKFDQTLAMVTSIVSGGSLMISILAILVIVASVKGYEADERRKNGLLLSFGQSKANCVRLALYEWLITGFIAGGGAVLGTVLMGVLVFETQFKLPYHPDWLWLVATMVVVIAVMSAFGLFGSRASLQSSPKTLLQS